MLTDYESLRDAYGMTEGPVKDELNIKMLTLQMTYELYFGKRLTYNIPEYEIHNPNKQ